MNLIDVHKQFATDDDCLTYLEQQRWPDGVRCVTCGCDRISRIESSSKKQKSRKLFQCLEESCKQQFTTTSGTIFHDTHLPLTKWFLALALISESKKGISANQVHRALGISYKAAWYLCHRIRKAMADGNGGDLLGGTVEIDETYVGGKKKGMRGRVRKIDGGKDVVIGIRQRKVDGHKGELRFFHAEDVKSGTLAKYIKENVSQSVDVIVTDEFSSYPAALRESGHGTKHHYTIQHKDGVYVKGQIHTNTVESAFSLLKRGIVGSFHKVSIKHLNRYLSEFEYRFNNRESADLFSQMLQRMTKTGNLEFKELIAKQ